MRDKEIEQTEGQESLPQQKPYVESPRFGSFFEKKGIYDGKLFHSRDKVTYTFVDNEEVVSLHFDRVRKTIFYKGHNIDNLELAPEQMVHLELFGQELEKNTETAAFAHSYNKVFQKYLKNHPV